MATQRTHVPAYGNWEGEDGVLYKEIFAKARKGQTNATTKMVNPNDPEEDPEMLKESEMEDRKDSEAAGMVQERRMSEDSLEFKRNLHSHPTKPSAGSDYSNEKSPMHKHGRVSGTGSSSPMWEGRATRDGIQGTPGRSHLAASSRGDNPDKGVTVPKFGGWENNDPAAVEGYTQVFTAIREERQGVARSGNDAHVDSSRSSAARRANASGSKGCCCCCPWLRT